MNGSGEFPIPRRTKTPRKPVTTDLFTPDKSKSVPWKSAQPRRSDEAVVDIPARPIAEIPPKMLTQRQELTPLIQGKKIQSKIFELDTGGPDGVDAIMWQDASSSNLYLDFRSSGNPILGADRINPFTSRDVVSLAKSSGVKGKIMPDAIAVKTDDDPISKMRAKRTVLSLLPSPANVGGSQGGKWILKETGLTLDPTDTRVVVTYSVKNRELNNLIMSSDTLTQGIGGGQPKDPAEANIASLLSTYHQKKLLEIDGNNLKVDQDSQRDQKPKQVANEIDKPLREIAQDLSAAIQTLVKKSGISLFTNKKMDLLKKLGGQVDSAIADGFKDELDTVRWQRWNGLNPLTEDAIVPGTKEKAGSGAQGDVFKYQLSPAGSNFTAVLKYDATGINSDARAAGIPGGNPQQSTRAVATFQISKALNLGIIPRTERFVGTDENDRPILGQALGFVDGYVGLKKVAMRDGAMLSAQEMADEGLNDALDLLNHSPDTSSDQYKAARDKMSSFVQVGQNWFRKPAPIPPHLAQNLDSELAISTDPTRSAQERTNARDGLTNYVKIGNKWYNANYLPVDIPYDRPIVQKGLSDLQLLDYLIGHADRNAGNWIFEKDAGGNITGVKGIDNDDTFGKNWSTALSKTPDVPPVVDVSTALAFMTLTPQDFLTKVGPSLAGLSADEVNNTVERFKTIQGKIKDRINNGDIASSNGEGGVDEKLATLNAFRDTPDVNPLQTRQKLVWGADTVARHTGANSYLGMQLSFPVRAIKDFQGTQLI